MHNKDNLDNIRRKAPAPRKQQLQSDEAGSQQIEGLQNQVRELSKMQNSMEGRLQKLTNENNAVIQELHNMQESLQNHENQMHAHEAVMQKLIQFLWKLDEEIKGLRQASGIRADHPRGDGEQSEVVSPANSNTGFAAATTSPNGQNDSSTPLQQAQRLINSFTETPKPNTPLQNMPELGQPNQSEADGGYDNYNHAGRHSQTGQRPASLQSSIQSVGADGGHLYGMGTSSGMVEVYSNGQGGNIGFPMPPPQAENGVLNQSGRPNSGRKKSSSFVPSWSTPPRVLLVEDDPTCARIGTKFLQTAQCGVDMAVRFSHLWLFAPIDSWVYHSCT